MSKDFGESYLEGTFRYTVVDALSPVYQKKIDITTHHVELKVRVQPFFRGSCQHLFTFIQANPGAVFKEYVHS